MLVVDPLKRITIPEIRAHPWFRTKLPLYLSVPPSVAEAEAEAASAARKHMRRRMGLAASFPSRSNLLTASTGSLGGLESAAARETLGLTDEIDGEQLAVHTFSSVRHVHDYLV